MKIVKIGLLGCVLSLATAAQGADFEEASMALCEKMKQCTLAEMGDQEGMSPEMKDMIMNSMAGICDAMQAQFSSVQQLSGDEEDIAEAAGECMQSMAELSCSELMGGGEQPDTQACQDYQTLAQEYTDKHQ